MDAGGPYNDIFYSDMFANNNNDINGTVGASETRSSERRQILANFLTLRCNTQQGFRVCSETNNTDLISRFVEQQPRWETTSRLRNHFEMGKKKTVWSLRP
jgi:hypothetical protein